MNDNVMPNQPEQEEISESLNREPAEVRPAKDKRIKKKKHRILRITVKCILSLILVIVVAFGGWLGYMTAIEYNPKETENAEKGKTIKYSKISSADMSDIKIFTFNTGYAGLGEDADFFMCGGEGVNPESQVTVNKNLSGIGDIIREHEADIVLLQEVDIDSDRTFNDNQWTEYQRILGDYSSYFAYNYSCEYVPYPLNEHMGKINSGITTFNKYIMSSGIRYQLPCPFTWPTRVFNLKRCLLITRTPIEGRKEELVVINLHLEAFDDGEGKKAQIEALMKILEEEYSKGNYVIAGGDFNQVLPETLDKYPIKGVSKWLPAILEELPEGWQYAFDDETPTCRLLNQPYCSYSQFTQYYVIDGFIVSPNVEVKSIKTIDRKFKYSDHNPVLGEFALKEAVS